MAELPQSAEKTERLRVVVRCRPPSTVEEKLPCVLLDEAAAQVVVQRTDRAEQPLLFTFNGVLGADSTQEQAGSQPLVSRVAQALLVNGCKACLGYVQYCTSVWSCSPCMMLSGRFACGPFNILFIGTRCTGLRPSLLCRACWRATTALSLRARPLLLLALSARYIAQELTHCGAATGMGKLALGRRSQWMVAWSRTCAE